MIQEETLEYNKRCADFLGYSKPITDKDFYFVEHLNYDENSIIPKLLELSFEKRFYSDWNWIHEVIEAIEKLGFVIEIISSPTISKRWMFYKIVITKDTWTDVLNNNHSVNYSSNYNNGESKKEAVVQAINQFLIFYNNEKIHNS